MMLDAAKLKTLRLDGAHEAPLHEQLRNALQTLIERCDDGDVFYSDSVLVQHLPVSKITVRRALQDLSDAGWLRRRRGIGTIVTRPNGMTALATAGHKRGLAAGRSRTTTPLPRLHTIGIFADNYSSEYTSALSDELAQCCIERRLKPLLYHANNGARLSDAFAQLVGSPDEEACVLMLNEASNLLLYSALSGRGYRCIAVEGVSPAYAGESVVTDAAAAVRIGLEHLFSLGHERIALLVNEPAHIYSVTAKIDEFVEVMADRFGEGAGKVVVANQSLGADSFMAAYTHMETLWAIPERERPTAIFTVSDPGAWAVQRWLAERGVRVPGDVSVLGFEDARSSRFMHPALTTVAHPLESIARRAVEVLHEGPSANPRHDLIVPKLIVRDSTGTARKSRPSAQRVSGGHAALV